MILNDYSVILQDVISLGDHLVLINFKICFECRCSVDLYVHLRPAVKKSCTTPAKWQKRRLTTHI